MTGSVYDTRDRLKDLADVWHDLEAALGGIKGVIYDDMPKAASSERQLVIRAGIADLMAEIESWTKLLARVILDEHRDTKGNPLMRLHRGARTPGLLRGLAAEAEWIVNHQEFGPIVATEAADWITKAQKQLNPGHRKAKMPGCRQPGCNGTYTANNGRLTCSSGNPLHTVNITRPVAINEAALARLRQAATR